MPEAPQISPEAQADQDYAARAKRANDLAIARAYFTAHPEELPAQPAPSDPTIGMGAPKSPQEAAAQGKAVEGADNTGLSSEGAVDELATHFIERPVTSLTGSPVAGKIAKTAALLAPIALGVGRAATSDLGLLGTAGEVGEVAPGAEAVAQAAAQVPASEAAAAPVSSPEAAAQSLAQKQLDALKTARVGNAVAEEFGKPELATKVSEAETLQQAQDLKLNLESVYNEPVTAPTMSSETAALAKVFQGESQDLHKTATDILGRMNGGEDVSADMAALSNRFSAFAVQYAKIAGTRSEAGRALEILNPLKPENVRVTETAKLAQQMGEGNNPRDLVEMLARLTPEQLPRASRQIAESVGMGQSIYNAIHEYYIDNLLSNAVRTSGRIGLSNTVSALMQIPSRQVAAMLPGSPIKMGEPLAQMEGISNGFWHAVDAARESFKTGDRIAMMEDAPEASPLVSKPSIAAAPFGLEGTTLGTALDYLGSTLRLPQRGLTAAHQFGWSIYKSMEMHGLAWRQAVDQAAGEGLSGIKGYNRAGELYRTAIKQGFTPEIRAAASDAADVGTFANAIEGKAPQALQTLAHTPGLDMVIPFFRVAYNIKKMGLDYTPGVGAITGLATAPDSAARYMVAGRQALASVMAGLAAYETIKGNLTGDGPVPGAARDALLASGWQPNSWKVGDRYIKIPEPLAFPLSTVANMVELGRNLDAPTYAQKVALTVQAMSRALANDSLVQGLVNLKQMANDAAESGFGPATEKFLGKTAAGFVPFSGAVGAIRRAEDPTIRNPQTIGENIRATLPDLPGGAFSDYTAGSVQPRYDIFHKPAVGMPGVPQNLLFPVNVTKEKLDPVEQMIIDVQPRFASVPSVLSGRKARILDNPNDPDIGVPLTPKQQDQWSAWRADGLYEQLDNLRTSPAFKNSSQAMKKTLLEYVGAKYAEIASAKMLTDPAFARAYIALQQARANALTPPDEFSPETTSFNAPEVR